MQPILLDISSNIEKLPFNAKEVFFDGLVAMNECIKNYLNLAEQLKKPEIEIPKLNYEKIIPELSNPPDARFGYLLQLISEQDTIKSDIKKLSRKAGLSQKEEYRKFNEWVKKYTTPRQILIKFIIEKSKKLLLEKSSTIDGVATALGFCDQPAFQHKFKEITQMTCREFIVNNQKIK